MSATAETVQEASLETLIEQLYDFREQKRALESEVKVINAAYREVEIQFIEAMNAAGINKASIEGLATCSIKEQEVATLKDFAALSDWIAEAPHERLTILQKRVSATAFKDFASAELEGEVPGVERFTNTKVNLRALR
jgi:hypothetical protein